MKLRSSLRAFLYNVYVFIPLQLPKKTAIRTSQIAFLLRNRHNDTIAKFNFNAPHSSFGFNFDPRKRMSFAIGLEPQSIRIDPTLRRK